MDTKTLYDLASEANIGFQHNDGFQDARQVWIDGYMKSPEWLMDIWIDALAGLKVEDATSLLDYIGKTHYEVETAYNTKTTSTSLKMSMSTGVIVHSAFLGQRVYIALLEFVEKYVESECETWWADCQGYHSDMMEGAREDHLYQQYKDRKLDERV
jgi:hypothetical protein